jgi:UDP-N-acetylglucosamine--N-acetylmuramyl-(pentapeptide) pyrophosphoryl-undecaprenol N-acetylglucosamine transferase
MSRLLIAASGTGGHLFPALAVARAVPADWTVQWLGVPDRLEQQLVPSEYPLHVVKAGGLQGRGLRKLANLLRLLGATWTVRQLIRRERIRLVFSSGGYIAAPAILAARWCGIPVVLHESNGVPGKVTRLLGRFCTQVALACPRRQSGCTAASRASPAHRCARRSSSLQLCRTGYRRGQARCCW